MRIMIILSLFAFLGINQLVSQQLELYKVVDIDKEFCEKNEIGLYSLKVQKKTDIAKYYAINITDVITDILNKAKSSIDVFKTVFIFESEDSTSVTITFNDINRNITQNEILLILHECKGSVNEKIILYDKSNKSVNLNMGKAQKELDEVVETVVPLALKTGDKASIKKMIRPKTLVFYQDRDTDRWLQYVNKLKIYILK